MVAKGERSSVLLILDVALVALVALALWLAARRGRALASRSAGAPREPNIADLIPGQATGRTRNDAPSPRMAARAPANWSTWSASVERGETGPPVEPTPAGVARGARPAVVVAPRAKDWVVAREGASRVSSVHASRDAAEARGHKTARREQVVLEVRDDDATVIDRTDYTAGRTQNARTGGRPEERLPEAVVKEPTV